MECDCNTKLNDPGTIIRLRKAEISIETVLVCDILKNGKAWHTLFATLRNQWHHITITIATKSSYCCYSDVIKTSLCQSTM